MLIKASYIRASKILISLIIILLSFSTYSLINIPDLNALQGEIALDKEQYYGRDFTNKIEAYKNTDGIKNFLQTVISINQLPLNYETAKFNIFRKIDLILNNGKYAIKDVYCQKIYTAGIGPDKVPHYELLNVEHTWPQSRFNKKYPTQLQKSDLHHLFPSDSLMNNKRGNYKFGIVNNSAEPLKCDESKLGRTSDGYRFEPPNCHKGEVARAIFYFSTRYSLDIDSDEEDVLRKWSKDDPPDQVELTRHEEVFKTQHNRNPFIDFPGLEDSIKNF